MNEVRTFVVDASVVVKWFIREERSDAAVEVRDKFVEGRIHLAAPSLLYFEVLNALKYSRLFDTKDLELAAEALENYGIEKVEMRRDAGREMVRAAVDYDLTIYDASYVGLALHLGVPFITADEGIKKKLADRLGNVRTLREIGGEFP
ncbi:MAG: type II toxin-antitoxin system VapC family toxin [Promethearchaeota archaeon]